MSLGDTAARPTLALGIPTNADAVSLAQDIFYDLEREHPKRQVGVCWIRREARPYRRPILNAPLECVPTEDEGTPVVLAVVRKLLALREYPDRSAAELRFQFIDTATHLHAATLKRRA